jgi:pantetheine-phosphate adenylyltransferase
MRVIAGSAKGRRLRSSRGDRVRPTADRVKEALFSMLLSRFRLEGAVVLDLFAGSGALGIEALSRGAASAVFVEQSRAARAALAANLDACGFAAVARIVALPVARALRDALTGTPFSGVLLDPPYGRGLADAALRELASRNLLAPAGWAVVEHHVEDALADAYDELRLTATRRYGKTAVTLYVRAATMGTSAITVNRKAVYAGSFDPITKGHLDIVRRALGVFDQIIVAVAHNPAKDTALFSAPDRVEMIRAALTDVADRVSADSFSGLLVEYCDQVGASAIIRGLRAVSDFEYEFQMAMMNHHLNTRVETYFMTASETYFYTASRLVKEVASLGGDVSALVPPVVHRALVKRFASRTPS